MTPPNPVVHDAAPAPTAGEIHDDTCDVIVVGSGPAGIAAAIHLHWRGRSVKVFDKAVFPRDKCCGDGLTTLALHELERIQFHPRAVPSWNPLSGAILVGPDQQTVRISLPARDEGLFAAVAPRSELDDALVAHARSLGVEIHEDSAIEAIRQERELVTATFAPTGVVTAHPQRRAARVHARYLIAADGAWSPTRRLLGAHNTDYRGDWQAMRQYYQDVTGPSATEMMVWFEPDLLPGYAWSFPLPGGRANVGFGVLRSQHRTGSEVAKLWASLPDRPHIREALGPDARPVGRHTAWPIPARIGGPSLSDHRVLFVGDAAAASDVLTGEGIGQALLSGRLAAEAIVTGGSNQASAATSTYQRQIRRHLSPDHKMSARLGSMMSTTAGARRALSTIDRSGEWGRRNFARWLFEDEPRGILLTPRRWHRRFLTRPGAYRSAPSSASDSR